MKFTVVSLFPELIEAFSSCGLVGQALTKGHVDIETLNPRAFTQDVHHTVDDKVYGGGDGMVMKVQPLLDAVRSLRACGPCHVAVLTPQGPLWSQARAEEYALKSENIVLVCGRYAGIDHRFHAFVDDEISLGDFILNGGELAACSVIESVSRLRPGVLGNMASAYKDSFSHGHDLECPQFTRPREIEGLPVPAPLLSGHHEKVRAFEAGVALVRTALLRPELLLSLQQEPQREALARHEHEHEQRLAGHERFCGATKGEDSPSAQDPTETVQIRDAAKVSRTRSRSAAEDGWGNRGAAEISAALELVAQLQDVELKSLGIQREQLELLQGTERTSVNVALIHWPVFDRAKNIVCTNVTNFDIHDIARAGRTYGVDRYFIVNRLKEQLSFVSRVLDHWRVGVGSEYNPKRKTALGHVELAETLEDVLSKFAQKPLIITTSARDLGKPKVTFKELRAKVWDPATPPILLVFGTGFGLHDSVLNQADMLLEPLKGASKDDYRHLSVRSAVSIVLDRLLGAC